MSDIETSPRINVEQAGMDLIGNSSSPGGEEEMLRIASEFSLQLDADQIRAILYVESFARRLALIMPAEGAILLDWAKEWRKLKKNNHSDVFMVNIMDRISLRKYFNENTFKVNIDKWLDKFINLNTKIVDRILSKNEIIFSCYL